jgi:RNA polymerase sigma-70 factor (ECF subfamily)
MKEGVVPKSIIISISEDDTIAFRKLYDLLYLRLFRFCGYFVKSTELKEEIVSDVFLTIWQNRNHLLKIENPEAYIYTIARNRSLYYLKQKKADLLDSTPEVMVEVVFDETPETRMVNNELGLAIEKAINELPERCRMVFLMAKEEGFKYKEIAEILSVSEKTVNAQMVTAMKKLHESLKKLLGVFFSGLF